MISAPEVMTRPVAARPRATDSALSPVAVYASRMRDTQEDLVVHRQAEQHGEEDQRQRRGDQVGAVEAEQAAEPAPLEDGDHDAVRARRSTAGSSAAAFSGTTTDRNTIISSRNDASRIAADEQRQAVRELLVEVAASVRSARSRTRPRG